MTRRPWWDPLGLTNPLPNTTGHAQVSDQPAQLNTDTPRGADPDADYPPIPPELEEKLADATPRESKTVGQLTLNDRGALVEVTASGLTVRGVLQDFRAEQATEWEAYGAPNIISGPVTLDILGTREYTAAIVTCWPTDPITITRRHP